MLINKIVFLYIKYKFQYKELVFARMAKIIIILFCFKKRRERVFVKNNLKKEGK